MAADNATDRQTTKYCNPRCACMPRVYYYTRQNGTAFYKREGKGGKGVRRYLTAPFCAGLKERMRGREERRERKATWRYGVRTESSPAPYMKLSFSQPVTCKTTTQHVWIYTYLTQFNT